MGNRLTQYMAVKMLCACVCVYP